MGKLALLFLTIWIDVVKVMTMIIANDCGFDSNLHFLQSKILGAVALVGGTKSTTYLPLKNHAICKLKSTNTPGRGRR